MRVGDQTKQDASVQSPAPFVGTFTRDMTAATGSAAITGIGFTPSAVLFSTAIEFSIAYSMGFAGDNTERVWGLKDDGTSDWEDGGSNICMYIKTGGGQAQAGGIDSYDSDGFTVGWIKVGTPAAGTARVNFIAYK